MTEKRMTAPDPLVGASEGQSMCYDNIIPPYAENVKPVLRIIGMDEIQTEKVEWLWYPYIPFGKITIIKGDPGGGKTTLMLQLAALLSKGENLPEDNAPREQIKIIYQTAEDGLADTIKPRLEAGGADCSQIKVIDESETPLDMLDERLEQAIIQTGARLVILDPIQAYVGSRVDINRANEVRTVMSTIGRLAEKYKAAVVLVGHLNKSFGGKSSYRGLGSIDFQASARSVLIVGKLRDDPQIRIMAQDKSSLAPEGAPIAFELNRESGFHWIGKYDISIDELLNGFSHESKSELAKQFLRENLANGKVAQSELLERARLMGISKRVLDSAKKSLGVISKKRGHRGFGTCRMKVATLRISRKLQCCNVDKDRRRAVLERSI